MLNTVLVICWLASIFCIFYFSKRKPNKTYKIVSIVACVLLACWIGLLPSNRPTNNKNNVVTNSKTSSTSSISKNKGEQKREHKQKHEKNPTNRHYDESRLKAFAQAFGRKPVDDIQDNPSAYVTTRVGDQTVYGWHPEGLPELVRVDDPDTNNTDVYLYDKNGREGVFGRQLYTGRTIFQHQPKYIPQY